MEVLRIRNNPSEEWQEIAALVGPKGDKGDKGEPGAAFTYDMFTQEQLNALQGPTGAQGEPGKDGKDYVLTEEDKTEIASLVLAALPSAEEVSY